MMEDIDIAIMNEEFHPGGHNAAIGDRLVRGVADLYRLMYAAQAAHWNVTGPDFQQLHALFGECYEQAYKAIDDVAEQTRQLGTKLPRDLQELLGSSSFPKGPDGDSPEVYVRTVLQIEEVMKAQWDFIASDDGGNAGLNDLVSRLSGEHSKLAWKLRSTLGDGDRG